MNGGNQPSSINLLRHCPVCNELGIQWSPGECTCKNGHRWHWFPGSGVVIDSGGVFPSTQESLQKTGT